MAELKVNYTEEDLEDISSEIIDAVDDPMFEGDLYSRSILVEGLIRNWVEQLEVVYE
tara:strand:- start:56 stop:226 length:171 start_codon:yes stop_codon:yes gene_type:complete